MHVMDIRSAYLPESGNLTDSCQICGLQMHLQHMLQTEPERNMLDHSILQLDLEILSKTLCCASIFSKINQINLIRGSFSEAAAQDHRHLDRLEVLRTSLIEVSMKVSVDVSYGAELSNRTICGSSSTFFN